MKHIDEKLVVDYPCRWLYKLICTDEKALLSAIKEILADSEHRVLPSKKSRTGKYVSFNLEVMVHSEESRNFFFHALREHPAIKMVL